MDVGADTVRATGRDIQRQMFMSNIGRIFSDMDKMETRVSSRNAKLDALASSYVNSGMTVDETVELLVEDGFNVEMARNYVMSMVSDDSEDVSQWDYVYETVNGTIRRGSDRGHVVTASTREEAMEIAMEFISEDFYDKIDTPRERLLDVERI